MRKTETRNPWELPVEELKAYCTGFGDGNEGNYFPGGIAHEDAYDWGYRDGKKYGPRKGKPFTLAEILKGLAELPAAKR